MPTNSFLSFFFCVLLGSTLLAEDRVLFEFANPGASRDWQIVNDGVMGGISDGRFKITENKTLEFYGVLSLENSGGFASVRSRPKKLGLEAGDVILARLKGDGREYTLNLYVPRPLTAFSYRAPFKTTEGVWTEIHIPLDKFVATSFGRVLPNAAPLNPSEITSVGFLLSDKKAGSFKLEVEWIKASKVEAPK
jgi:NADH dehydrogenase [ubiquinone] 1 alpha subcomplex assembly factor 1